MNGLLVLIGESFRSMSPCGRKRIRGEICSYNEQMNACLSHKEFINQMKKRYNVNIKVFLSTYSTQYDEDIKNIYEDYLIGSHFDEELKGLTTIVKNSINYIENIHEYDFIYYCRIDLFMKDYFFEIFNPFWKTITFPSICWVGYCLEINCPRNNDTMLFIPKKYYEYIKDVIMSHECWYHFVNNIHLTHDDLDVMINTFHDSDSEKDFNPIYYLLNRPESSSWYSKDYVFIKPKAGEDFYQVGEPFK